MSWNSWNYRVLKRDDEYGVYEVYYDDSGMPHAMSEDPIAITGENLEDIRNELNLILESLEKDVLDYRTLKPIE